MTLIASYEVANVPVLLGDLLVSSTIPPEEPVVVPTRGDVLTNPDKSIHPIGLLQKICIINDDLMVAWSGSVIVARTVLRTFKEKFANKLVDASSIQSVVEDIGRVNLRDTQFIGLAKNKEGGLSRFRFGTYNFEHEIFGLCHVGGSGAGKFIEGLYGSGSLDIAGGSPGDTDLAVTHAITTAQSFLARELFSEEMVGQELFGEHFGGGFEVGVLTINGAEKVGDILHLFWIWNENKDAVPKLIPTFIKSDYVGKDLIIRRLHQVFDAQVGGWLLDDERAVIVRCPTESENASTRGLQLPDLNFRFLCSYYLGFDESGTGTSTTTLHHAPRGQGPITVEEAGNKIHFHFDLKHFKKEWKMVATHLSRNLKIK